MAARFLVFCSLALHATATSSACKPSTFTFPPLLGAAPHSIEAAPVYNYTSNPRYGPEALSVPASEGPSFCNVTLAYTRPGTDVVIRVQAWLPLSAADWNGRFVGVGGGGFATGQLGGDHMTALVHGGYAAATTDGGHDHRRAGEAAFWGLRSPGNVAWDALVDFAYRAPHDLAVVGRAATTQYFGGRAPEHSYWRGCSTGGRQGLAAAQRYPEDWDGILAACPAVEMPTVTVNGYWPQLVMRHLGLYPPSCEFDAIRRAAVAACDALDGVVDGVVSDPDACDFDVETAVGSPAAADCGPGTNISQAAATVASAFWTGPTDGASRPIGFGYSPGSPLTGPLGLVNTVCRPDGMNGTLDCSGAPLGLSTEWLRTFVAKDPDYDLESMATRTDFETTMRRSTAEYNGLLGSRDPDLSAFARLGKKMITWHAVDDEVLPLRSARSYYARVLARDPSAPDYYRYFEVPGANHCSAPPGAHYPLRSLEVLRRWVEDGVAPETLETVKLGPSGGGRDATPGKPVCAYPAKGACNGAVPSTWASF